MAIILKPFKFFYHEFGLSSIHETGRNAYLIILARACRMFAYGTNALVLALFFSELEFSGFRIGLFMTLTLLGDAFLSISLTLTADRLGRRKVLLGGSVLMVLGGLAFSFFENFWILLFAAVVGVISATGGDFGPFRAIEESMLSHLTTPKTRADVLSWHVTLATIGSSIGSEISGRFIHYLESLDGWKLIDAYHSLFWVYTAMGVVNAGLVLLLTDACEVETFQNGAQYTEIAQNEDADEDENQPSTSTAQPKFSKPTLIWTWLATRLATISAPTRAVMYRLCLLLAVDSIADGMVPYTLTNYYIDEKFHPSKSTLGDITSVAYFLGAFSAIFAGPLARKIGLINTMVFTHIPSSAAVAAFSLPNSFVITVILLFIRAGLNNMDQAPRAAFIAAVVKPEERTAAMGIVTVVRTLAATAGPEITGLLAGSNRFWIAFITAGCFRLAYDIGLYIMFVNIKLYQHEDISAPSEHRRERNIDEEVELDDLPSSDDSDETAFDSEPSR